MFQNKHLSELIVCIKLHIHQVVEEKRETTHGNIADAVENDAEDTDQESRAASEIFKIQAKFSSGAHYIKHLHDAQSHQVLRHQVQMHLWRKNKLEIETSRLLLFDRMLHDSTLRPPPLERS